MANNPAASNATYQFSQENAADQAATENPTGAHSEEDALQPAVTNPTVTGSAVPADHGSAPSTPPSSHSGSSTRQPARDHVVLPGSLSRQESGEQHQDTSAATLSPDSDIDSDDDAGSTCASDGAGGDEEMEVQASPECVRPRTRLQSGIRKEKVYTDGTVRYGCFTSSGEPSDHIEALKNKNWKLAMDSEYDALVRNNTWHLVPSQRGKNIIGCKWVYKIKRRLMDL